MRFVGRNGQAQPQSSQSLAVGSCLPFEITLYGPFGAVLVGTEGFFIAPGIRGRAIGGIKGVCVPCRGLSLEAESVAGVLATHAAGEAT